MTSYPRAYLVVFTALLFLFPAATRAATLGISPSSITTNAGGSVTETVFVSSGGQAMNASSGTISFPTDLLQVISVSKTNSILSLWVQDPTFSNTDGTITFSGIVPNPGYTGSYGKIFSIQFRGKKAGVASVIFRASLSEVLANDGNGTDILTSTNAATITINAPVPVPISEPAPVPSSSAAPEIGLLAHITSSTHPDETQWYKLSHAIFDWTNAQGISTVRLGYDKNADGNPSVPYNDPISHKELDLADGIWYFHVQEKDTGGWSPVSTYRVQIDTVPPLPFDIKFPNGTTTQSGSAIAVQFATSDDLSGIDHYQISVDGKESTASADEGSRPYALPADSGEHTLLVRAYDKAGNVAIAEGKFAVVGGVTEPSPLFTLGWTAVNYLTLALVALAVLGTLLFGVWYIRAHFSAYRRRLNHQLGLTHTHVHKEFDTLKEVITEEVLTLEQAKSKRSLTREEERIVARFKKLLDHAEQTIEKDLESIPQ